MSTADPMTVVLAIRCGDGLVVGADRQVTDREQGFSFPAPKLNMLGTQAAWGGSGSRSVLMDLEEIFTEASDTIVSAHDPGKALQARALPVLEHHYANYIPDVPGEPGSPTPSAYVLAAGYAGDTPWIVEITPNAMVGRYEEIGFHAIGSGAPMAHQAGALLAHFRMTNRDVRHGSVVAVRVLDALQRTSPSVGGPIDVVRITPDGAVQLDRNEVEQARDDVARWEELEQRALDELFT